jgi:hypothetical protein
LNQLHLRKLAWMEIRGLLHKDIHRRFIRKRTTGSRYIFLDPTHQINTIISRLNRHYLGDYKAERQIGLVYLHWWESAARHRYEDGVSLGLDEDRAKKPVYALGICRAAKTSSSMIQSSSNTHCTYETDQHTSIHCYPFSVFAFSF